VEIEYKVSPPVSNQELNALFAEAWPGARQDVDFGSALRRSLGYVCAYRGNELVGFVNVAWDGGVHAFLLDTTVRSDRRRQGIGRQLVRHAGELARKGGAEWLHVDFEPQLEAFYRKSGFQESRAGLINLRETQMKTFAALFRGINVGGRNSLPMRELVELLEGLGLQEVKTYIQSGNVIFRSEPVESADLAGRMGDAIEKSHGFRPEVMLLEVDELQSAMAANPFPEAEAEPRTLHLYFLASEPENPDLEALEGVRRESERFKLEGKVFYLLTPQGIGRSKLAARVERSLGVVVTARNWRTVGKIRDMALE
jgi:uncharacterized protein (DUF1697 family)/GNAT superfamily N-acetyltransferase